MNYSRIILLSCCMASIAACASAQMTSLPSVSNTAKSVSTDDTQTMMFAATKLVMQHKFSEAQSLYDQVIAKHGSNADAYLQRGLVRRELGDIAGQASDAQTAVSLISAELQNNSNNSLLYYQRSLGERLLKNFGPARADLTMAMKLSGNANWQTDMQALELEEKMANATN